jgi:predicted ATPase/DNA-binding CsgD family transcriptional regulator
LATAYEAINHRQSGRGRCGTIVGTVPEQAWSFDPLIGRERLVADISAAIRDNRLVTLTGLGGVGKTRLAQAVVDASRLDREAVLVDCTTITEAGALPVTLAGSLGLSDQGDIWAILTSWAGAAPRLLALDNVEQVRSAAEVLGQLLATADSLNILATSRVRTGAALELEVAVPPLALPEADSVEDVEASAAGSLFLARARAVGRLHTPLAPLVAADVARICRLLDGLPLALEMAAGRTRILSPSAILTHLVEHDVAVLRRSEGEPRHHSLESVLDWTLGLLGEDERLVLQAASVCAGRSGLGLLEAMLPDVDVLLSIERLVTHALVAVEDEIDGEPQFRVPATVRLPSLERLGVAERTMRMSHAHAVASLLDRWAPRLDSIDNRRAVARLDAQRENVFAALDWATREDRSLASKLLWTGLDYWTLRGGSARAIAGGRALARDLSPDAAERPLVVAALSRLLAFAGDVDEARVLGEEALALGSREGIRAVEFEGLNAMLWRGFHSGDGDGTALQAVNDRLNELGPISVREVSIEASAQVLILSRESDSRAVEGVLIAAAARAEEAGSPIWLGLILTMQAVIALDRGRLADASHYGDRAAAVAFEIGDARREAHSLQFAGLARVAAGQLEAGREQLRRALALATAVDNPLSSMDSLRAIGSLAALTRRPTQAAWFLGAAEAAFAPTPVADPSVGFTSGASAAWRSARRAISPVRWEVARRGGSSAPSREAIDRAGALIDEATATPDRPSADLIRRLPPRHGQLTPREVEILTLLGHGRSDPQIAAQLLISPKTAAVHVANIKAKLGAANRVETALRARELGLVN